ncbi:hypothetical protein GCM10009759_02330 [Kitasatospora saccharophila]|uniref:SUKH-4 immunity protein of toxin-antitoxin system n=1 Tax=Kitasatospora saccharophila TaxID=407973 RepID=A0ABN2W5X4_9ACTN
MPLPAPGVRPVTRAELEAAYGTDGLRRVAPADLPACVTDPGARTVLTDIGLPTTPNAFLTNHQELILLTERVDDPATHWPDLPDGAAAMVVVGEWGPLFALDGRTGEVYAVPFLSRAATTFAGRPAHRDLHSFLRCQLAFGAPELNLLGDLMDPDTADWCRAHVPGFAELFPVEELDEDGWPIEEDPAPDAPAPDPADPDRYDPDAVIARLADKLRQIEPDLLHHPAWESILWHFRHGY